MMKLLQYKLDFWMFIRGISHGFNGTHDKLEMARNLKDIFVIFLDILSSRTTWWRLVIRYLHCTYIYVALTDFSHYHYGYCKLCCRVDYVIPYD